MAAAVVGKILGTKWGRKLLVGVIALIVYAALVAWLFDKFVAGGVPPLLAAPLSVAAFTGGVVVEVAVALTVP